MKAVFSPYNGVETKLHKEQKKEAAFDGIVHRNEKSCDRMAGTDRSDMANDAGDFRSERRLETP
jgi:hypothetical protein